MKNITKYTLAATALGLLAACGGGGGGSGGDTSTVSNTLSKYAGTYYHCENNEKSTLSLTTNGTDSLNATMAVDVYSNNNCSGNVIGSYRLLTPAVLTYKGKTTASMPPITILPSSGTVDEISMLSAGVTAQLTGSAVVGNCVKYAYSYAGGSTKGESCFDLTFPSTALSGALYLTADNNYLVQFSRENGVLIADNLYSKDSSFNYNMQVLD